MIHHHKCAAIEMFIDTVKNLDVDLCFQDTIILLLRKILKIQPNWEVIEVIERSLSDKIFPSKSKTVEYIKSNLDLSKKVDSDNGNKNCSNEDVTFNLETQLSENSKEPEIASTSPQNAM